MLFLIFQWAITTLLTFAMGVGTLRLLSVFLRARYEDDPELHPAIICLIGFSTLVGISAALSLFYPISDWLELLLLGVPLAYFFSPTVRLYFLSYFNHYPRFYWPAVLYFIPFLLVALFKAASPTEIFDDGIAHLQVIQTFREYGIVLGLGNLHPNFGYNTHSTLGASLFSFPFLPGGPSYDLNAWLACLFAWRTSSLVRPFFKRESTGLSFLAMALPVFILRNQLTGLATDPPLYLLVWMLILEWLHADITHPNANKAAHLATFVLLPLAAITFKPNGVALLALSIAFLLPFYQKRQFKIVFLAFLLVLAFLGVWVLRNLGLTGYLYILFPSIDLFSYDWKVPPEVLSLLKDQVKGEIFHQPLHFSSQFLSAWWAAWPGSSKLIGLLALCSLIFFAALPFLPKNFYPQKTDLWRVLPVGLTVIIGLLIWLFTATEPRYGHAYLAILALSSIAFLVHHFTRIISKLHLALAFTFLICAATFNAYKSFSEFSLWGQVLLIPAPYPSVVSGQVLANNFVAYMPLSFSTSAHDRLKVSPPRASEVERQQAGCWDSPFPCVYRCPDLSHLQQRGITIRQGFRYIP